MTRIGNRYAIDTFPARGNTISISSIANRQKEMDTGLWRKPDKDYIDSDGATDVRHFET
ncbi:MULTISPECIES: hypothetical protein [unclassified Methanoregula]|uniref:hypothetical protein n=1 Tax=unclassified Methanoregula TaxID=2649730 RepID=UPI0025EBE9DD|nr:MULTISPECIES: hypothetical protein [unclassified Methanoregula]